MTAPMDTRQVPAALEGERFELVAQIAGGLERPMTLLAFLWLVLVAVELTVGLSPLLNVLNLAIWALFVLQFALEFTIAPRKGAYLRRIWLTAVALVLPALRVLRVLRVLRAARAVQALSAARGVRLVRVVSSANPGMRTLGRVVERRGLSYVLALTLLVDVLGAASMLAFERDVSGGAIASFGTALWWTAMTLTTMGSDHFPRTPEGRVLGLLLAVDGFAVFGYLTAYLASFFVARDAEADEGELAGTPQIDALRAGMAALNQRVEALLLVQRDRPAPPSERSSRPYPGGAQLRAAHVLHARQPADPHAGGGGRPRAPAAAASRWSRAATASISTARVMSPSASRTAASMSYGSSRNAISPSCPNAVRWIGTPGSSRATSRARARPRHDREPGADRHAVERGDRACAAGVSVAGSPRADRQVRTGSRRPAATWRGVTSSRAEASCGRLAS